MTHPLAAMALITSSVNRFSTIALVKQAFELTMERAIAGIAKARKEGGKGTPDLGKSSGVGAQVLLVR